MMANYSNQKNRKKRAPGVVMRGTSRKNFFAGLFLAALGGYVLAYFYPPGLLHVLIETKPATPPSTSTASTAALPKPQFEFYTLLTQEKGTLKTAPLKSATDTAVGPISKPAAVISTVTTSGDLAPSKYRYLLQLASFQRQTDAEQMKASFIMRGFDVQIRTVSQQGGVWYRVVLGPFASREKAEKIQAEIAHTDRISSIIRRMDA